MHNSNDQFYCGMSFINVLFIYPFVFKSTPAAGLNLFQGDILLPVSATNGIIPCLGSCDPSPGAQPVLWASSMLATVERKQTLMYNLCL